MKKLDSIKTLEMRLNLLSEIIDEQAITFDKINDRFLALVGLVFTFSGLLASKAFEIKTPNTFLEYFVVSVSIILMLIAAFLALYGYKPIKNWVVPLGDVEDTMVDNAKDYEDALRVIHKDYLIVRQRRSLLLIQKSKLFKSALWSFLISVLLLIILRISDLIP